VLAGLGGIRGRSIPFLLSVELNENRRACLAASPRKKGRGIEKDQNRLRLVENKIKDSVEFDTYSHVGATRSIRNTWRRR
jgi:hypothetical protein